MTFPLLLPSIYSNPTFQKAFLNSQHFHMVCWPPQQTNDTLLLHYYFTFVTEFCISSVTRISSCALTTIHIWSWVYATELNKQVNWCYNLHLLNKNRFSKGSAIFFNAILIKAKIIHIYLQLLISCVKCITVSGLYNLLYYIVYYIFI